MKCNKKSLSQTIDTAFANVPKKIAPRVFELQYRYLRQNFSYNMLGNTFQ